MEKNGDLMASIVLKKYSESKEYGTISEAGNNTKGISNGRPKGKIISSFWQLFLIFLMSECFTLKL